MNDKKYTDEMLSKYISSEIDIIEEIKKDKKNWKKNDEYHSQIVVRKVDDEDV